MTLNLLCSNHLQKRFPESALIKSWQEIRDFRASKGKRYPLWLILLLVIMGTLSGCRGYQALEDFGVRHYQAVSQKLELTINRLPSDTTFRRILHQLDFQMLAQQFEQWALQLFRHPTRRLGGD